MPLIVLLPAAALAFIGTLVAQSPLERRNPAGIERERAARGTLAWWTRSFHYRAADFTPEGFRYWRIAQALQLAALAWLFASWQMVGAAPRW